MRIGILGGGYGGLRTALDLARLKRQAPGGPPLEVDLIERAPRHRVIIWMHQVAAGTLSAPEATIDYGDLPLEGITLRHAEVRGLDPEGPSAETSQGTLSYDRLVLALGSLPLLPPIPALAEHAHTLRDREGAEALHAHLERSFTRAGQSGDPDERRRLATVAVVGGGYTGCQLAGELAHRLPDLADRNRVPIRDVKLVLIERQDRLLPGMAPSHGRCARRLLEEKGVEVRAGAALERVTGVGVLAGGRDIPCGTLAWAGGIRGPEVLGGSGLARDGHGRIRVDDRLTALGQDGIRAIGDCAVREDDPGAEATAVEAISQGRYLAGALWREGHARGTVPYRPGKLGLLVALGNADAVGTIGPVPVCGRGAGLIKNAAEHSYPETLYAGDPGAFLRPA